MSRKVALFTDVRTPPPFTLAFQSKRSHRKDVSYYQVSFSNGSLCVIDERPFSAVCTEEVYETHLIEQEYSCIKIGGEGQPSAIRDQEPARFSLRRTIEYVL